MLKQGDEFKKGYIRATSDKFLFLTLLPTEKCNFRCKYCYEDFKLGRMPAEVITGIENLISAEVERGLSNLVISWFGGEPTLNSSAVFQISEHVCKLQDTHDFVYSSHMTTNGYLLDIEMLERFVSLGLDSFQITLDGEQSGHDKTRVRADGAGTFDRIWANLLSFKDSGSDFEIDLRLHVSKGNEMSMESLSDDIAREFSSDSRYKVNFEKIKDLGTGVSGLSPNEFIDELADERIDKAVERFRGKLANVVADIEAGNSYICYAAMPRQLMIRANGAIGKCTVLLDDERNNLGQINQDGTFSMHDGKRTLWTRGFESLDHHEIGCPAKNLPNFRRSSNAKVIPIVAAG